MRLVLDKLEEYQPGNIKLRQFAGDLADSIKSNYERGRTSVTGGKEGAGLAGSSFFESLGLTGIAKAYKEKSEAKEQRRQDKEKFIGDFQQYSEAGKTLSADTSRQIADSLFEEIASKREELKRLQEEEARIREAGYKVSEENLAKQKELVDAIKNLDPRTGDKQEGSADQSLNQIQSAEKEMEAAEVATEHFEVQKKEQEDITALYTITDDHFKKMDKRTEEMLEALKVIAENGVGGGGGGLLSSAADLLGRGGKAAGTAGKVGKLAGMAGKLGTVAKVGGGILAVGTAAADAYGDYSEAQRQVDAGEITKEQGQVKKGEAVGGGVGAAGGALAGMKAGAALGTFLGPVGTVVGGLLGGAAGYIGGKYLGKKAGGGAVSGYQAVTGTGGEMAAPAASQAAPAGTETTSQGQSIDPEVKAKDPLYQKIFQEELKLSGNNRAIAEKFADKRYLQEKNLQSKTGVSKVSDKSSVSAATQATPEKVPTSQAVEIQARRRGVQDAEAAAAQTSGNNTNVNAPVTNVVNNTTTQQGPKDTKNADTTFQKYLDRRYYPAA